MATWKLNDGELTDSGGASALSAYTKATSLCKESQGSFSSICWRNSLALLVGTQSNCALKDTNVFLNNPTESNHNPINSQNTHVLTHLNSLPTLSEERPFIKNLFILKSQSFSCHDEYTVDTQLVLY